MPRRRRVVRLLCAGLALAASARPGRGEGGAAPDLLFRGDATVEVAPGGRRARLPGCRDCHGRDGAGGREGDVVAPPISHHALTRAALGRPAYDEASFAEAVRTGTGRGGRRLRAIMPRYPLGPEEIAALWRHLEAIDAAERRGVQPDTVRLGIDMRAGRRLYELMVAMMDGIRLHGRGVELVPIVDPTTLEQARLLALLFTPDLALRERDGGLPLLFPSAPLDERTRPDEARSLAASRRDQAEALLKAAPPSAEIVADEPGRALLPPDDARSVLDAASLAGRSSWPRDIVVLAESRRLAEIANVLPAGVTVHAIGPEVAGLLPGLVRSGVGVVVTDPASGPNVDRSHPAIDRMARTAATVLRLALAAAGRDLTRGALLRGFDGVRLDGADWPNLDYGRFERTGTRQVGLLRQ